MALMVSLNKLNLVARVMDLTVRADKVTVGRLKGCPDGEAHQTTVGSPSYGPDGEAHQPRT